MKKFILGFLTILFCCGVTFLEAQAFDPQGKLDPFIDLTTVTEDDDNDDDQPEQQVQLPDLSNRPPGLAGLAISEITITGIVVGEESKVVLFRGVDNFTYLAREGNKLYNGHVAEISEEGVIFVQEMVDSRGNRETKRVVRKLFTEED